MCSIFVLMFDEAGRPSLYGFLYDRVRKVV